MIEKFKGRNFGATLLAQIDQANSIIAEYTEAGQSLTTRQLYYQFVSRGLMENNLRCYKNLANLISDARLAGLIDWDAIKDRLRVPSRPSEWPSIRSLMDVAMRSYRLPRWEGQHSYAELWVEKDALAGVLAPLASQYHVTMLVNRGYSSQSAMHDAAGRYIEQCLNSKAPVLFYLGDHDPSGEDMVRDIRERLEMFGVAGMRVEKIALTMDQIDQHRPPPNPAKITDPRAQDYIAKHGEHSWEVDALDPRTLAGVIREAFDSVIDRKKMDKVIAREKRDKKKIEAAMARIDWDKE